MDMDTDWCLTCNRRVEGSTPYCSLNCQSSAGPSNYYIHSTLSEHYSSEDQDEFHNEAYYHADNLLILNNDNNHDDDDDADHDSALYHPNVEAVSKTNWAGRRGPAGILAWAAEIPLGAHPDIPYYTAPPPPDDTCSLSPISSNSSSIGSTYRAPNLVRPSRPLPPSLTMSKPEPPFATPPRPILSIQDQLRALSLPNSPGSTARTSVLSEDSLPTPASTHAMPFSTILGRPFPCISDARAHELAACTQQSSPSGSIASQKDANKYIIRSRGKPVAPRIVSSSQTSLDDDVLRSSPPWWATNSMVARHATKDTAFTKHICSDVRKDNRVAFEAMRGRRSSRVAA